MDLFSTKDIKNPPSQLNYRLRVRGRRQYTKQGFSLLEVLMTIGIIAVVTLSLFQLFIYCSTLTQFSIDVTKSVAVAQSKMEEIRQHNFDLITTDYASGGTPGDTFSFFPGTGQGVIYIDSSNSELIQVDIVVSWKEPNQRIIGEDANLNGNLDAGEDLDGNGKIDSPVHLATLIADK